LEDIFLDSGNPEIPSVMSQPVRNYDYATKVLSNGECATILSGFADTFNLFYQKPAHTFSREEILDATGTDTDISDRSMNARAKRLRRSIDGITNGRGKDYLCMVYGVGYYYEPYPDNIKSHPYKAGVSQIVNPGLAHKSDNTITVGHTVLDLGRSRLYLGFDFVDLKPKPRRTLELLFTSSNGRLLTQDFVKQSVNLGERKMSDNLPKDAMRHARDALTLLLPSGEDVFKIICNVYGEGYVANLSRLAAILPTPVL
jgi:DNA-binding response OmpR family regulator